MIGRLRISPDSIRTNAGLLRELVAPAKTAFVVKSNAYGHGLVRVARALEELADRLCVFAIEEALELADAGIRNPVLILGPVPPQRLDDAMRIKAELTLWDSGSYLKALAEAARKAGAKARVHLKVDTGTARFGIRPEDAQAVAGVYAQTPELEVSGISSHLASAEDLDSGFTFMQLERFRHAAEIAQNELKAQPVKPLRHIAASAAAMIWPQMRLDMVRIGIAVYGLWPSPQVQAAMSASKFALTPALSFESELAAVRDVESGTPVGYGSTFRAPKKMRTGIVPLGYADGIPRALSNNGAFIAGGKKRAIIGRVCMNATFLDLGDDKLEAGEKVTLIGSQDDTTVSADDWATWGQTLNYEILARLPSGLPRVYEA